MPDDLMDVDFKGEKVEVKTGKAAKIGKNWIPFSQCPAAAALKTGDNVGVLQVTRFIAEQKDLLGDVKVKGETISEIIQRTKVQLGTKEVQSIKITCPACKGILTLEFTVNGPKTA